MTASATTHRYVPTGAAKTLFGCRDPEVVLSGPAGTGKSRACLEKVHATLLAYPHTKALIVRKTFATLSSTALETYRKGVAAEWLDSGDVVFYGGSASQPAQYTYRNGSTIALAGMDQVTKIMSSEYDLIYVQEAIELTETDWESLSTRLRNGNLSYHQLIGDTNPSVPTHWLKQRANKGTVTMLESRHEDNPVLYMAPGVMTKAGADYLSRLDALTGPRHARLRKGLWVASDGMVYEDYDPFVHTVDKFPVPTAWPRWIGIDFGFTNPTVVQWWAEDPDGRLYLYRELYHTGWLTRDVAQRMQVLHGREPRPLGIICDHDAEDRATLDQVLKWGTTAADKRVTVGIQAVADRLRPAGDGKPRLMLMRGALANQPDPALVDKRKPTCTAEELPGYIWPQPRTTASAANFKEAPLKVDDHGCDALRYVIMARTERTRSRVRFI